MQHLAEDFFSVLLGHTEQGLIHLVKKTFLSGGKAFIIIGNQAIKKRIHIYTAIILTDSEIQTVLFQKLCRFLRQADLDLIEHTIPPFL